MKKLILIIISIVLISGCIENYNPYQREFAGVKLNFRANLNEAEKISVYPDEKTLRDVILNDVVEEIGIAYIPNETENSFYLAASYELAYKLTIINKYYFNRVKIIDSIPLNLSSDAFDIASEEKPIILLLGPPKANATAVETFADGHVVIAEGKSFKEVNVTYNDLDLAVDKILLVLMKEINS
jgi:hypothetical protein